MTANRHKPNSSYNERATGVPLPENQVAHSFPLELGSTLSDAMSSQKPENLTEGKADTKY